MAPEALNLSGEEVWESSRRSFQKNGVVADYLDRWNEARRVEIAGTRVGEGIMIGEGARGGLSEAVVGRLYPRNIGPSVRRGRSLEQRNPLQWVFLGNGRDRVGEMGSNVDFERINSTRARDKYDC